MRSTNEFAIGSSTAGARWLAQAGVAVLAALLIGVAAPPADAESPASADAKTVVQPSDAKDIRAVIQAQLDAFAADDAEKAFSFAAPGIRDMFSNAAAFLEMVRKAYPAVYRPVSVAYLVPQWASGTLVQPVQMNDADGKSWLALYTLDRKDKGPWRITGCRLAPNEGKAV